MAPMPKLLISGDRADFTTLEFDHEQGRLSLLANYSAPPNASWVESISTRGSEDCLIGLSEGTEAGLLYTFCIDHAEKTCNITSQQPTLGAPVHFVTVRDRSALALSTYLGGSTALYPLADTTEGDVRLSDGERGEILPPFPYAIAGHGPNPHRQRQCHPHQVLESRRGHLYVPDLGSDRVWVLDRNGLSARICGWLQCPPGTGPRHAVLAPDETIMYVIGELSHTVVAFDLLAAPASGIEPIRGFEPSIIPPSVHAAEQAIMDAAEICIHPSIPNVLYTSNRFERHISRQHSSGAVQGVPRGDCITIILLGTNGRQVKAVEYVRTQLDVIRGMRLSDNGRYLAAVGQEGGGVEIFEITGSRGEKLSPVASLGDAHLDKGVKHVVWL